MNISWPTLNTSNSVYGNFPMHKKASETHQLQLNNNNDGSTVNESNNYFQHQYVPQQQQQHHQSYLDNNMMPGQDTAPLDSHNCENNSGPLIQYLHGEEAMAELNKYLPNYQQQFYPTVDSQGIQNDSNNCQVGSGESGSPFVLAGNCPTEQEQQQQQQQGETSQVKNVPSESHGTGKRHYLSKSLQSSRIIPSGDKSAQNIRRSSPQQPSIYQVAPRAIRGVPSAPQINPSQPRLTSSQMKRMTNKPKFHLCGKCTKCKIIATQGNEPNTPVNSPSAAIVKTFQKTSPDRGYSSTIFPR